MTITGEYMPTSGDSGRSYPTLFGLTLTPAVSGALIGVLGFGSAIYLGMQWVAPTWQSYQELKAKVDTKAADVEQKAKTLQRIEDVKASLARAKALNNDVRGVFSTQKTLETLLIDLNRLIVQSQAQLIKFQPDYATSGPVADGSLGPELNGKLKRHVTAIEFSGTFEQTLTIMRNMERLQTLLVVRDLSTSTIAADASKPALPQNQLKSQFKLYAYVPLTPEEIAAAAKATPPPAEPKK